MTAISRRPLILGLVSAGALAPFGRARAAETMRISIETNPTHVRNENTEAFMARVRERLGGRVQPQLFPSAQLFRDRDIPRALRQGGVEMGQPGWWNLDGNAADAALPSLPMFYGLNPDLLHRIMDGPAGHQINRKIEERLRVKVLGSWWDLGPQHFYSAGRPITKYEDLRGMRIRHPGGSANAGRIRVLGGNPVLVPWPDVPLALSQNTVDGLITTHESANTAKLWDAGVKHCFEDSQTFNQYIPLVNQTFWNKLSPGDRDLLAQAWEEGVAAERAAAAAAQREARNVLQANGITIVTPSEADIVAARQRLMQAQDQMVSEIGMDRELVASVLAQIRAAGVTV